MYVLPLRYQYCKLTSYILAQKLPHSNENYSVILSPGRNDYVVKLCDCAVARLELLLKRIHLVDDTCIADATS